MVLLILKRPKLKEEIHFIDLKKKVNKREKMFTNVKEKVIKRGEIKCPPPSYMCR